LSEAKPSLRTIHQMRVTKIVDYNPQIRELFIETQNPTEFKFKAGQFVMLHVPQEGAPKPALRAYSIASSHHNQKGFQLIFKYVDNGLASKYVWDLKGGETLQFTGPFGRVLFVEPPTEQIIMLNTGSGVAQHLSYLLSFADKYPNLRYRMLFGVRHDEDIYYSKQLEEIKSQLKDFEFHYVLSRPTSAWGGKKGYVQNFMHEFNYEQIPTTFYLCGNGAMIKDARALLEQSAVPKERIWAEAFD
jgi:CDP-4-dehydro-6-deoxyglucose reductase, E3